jgi:tRNA(Arg) A34 adenosine deaminase TadA
MARGDEPFGSVLVKDGGIILRAENSVFTDHDMTNHAELNLVKLAAQNHDSALRRCKSPQEQRSDAVEGGGIPQPEALSPV